MFISRRKLRQTIEELEVENSILKSENEALNKASEMVTKAYQADMKKFQAENDRLRLDDERWRTQTDELVKEIERLSRKRDEKGRYIPNFKRGDIVSISYDGQKVICILAEPFDENKRTETIAHLIDDILHIRGGIGCAAPKQCKRATKEESNLLLAELEKEGCYWDGEDLSDIPF